jgi:hypothetical protein
MQPAFPRGLQGRHEMSQSLLLASGLAIILGSGALAARIDNPQAQDQNTMTVTGCLTASADGKTFTITESNAASMARPKNWTLVATGGVDLSKYANHKVEVTGSTPKGASASPTMSEDKTPAAAALGPKLEVKDVKDVSNTCS